MLGNLGSDGSGRVTEFVLEARPFLGFVKQECGGEDPSVNHLIIVDSSGGVPPTHSCDYERGGTCASANSDLVKQPATRYESSNFKAELSALILMDSQYIVGVY